MLKVLISNYWVNCLQISLIFVLFLSKLESFKIIALPFSSIVQAGFNKGLFFFKQIDILIVKRVLLDDSYQLSFLNSFK
jgi:hypothetical protein